MKIAILGAGAIGQLLAHQLTEKGTVPVLLMRTPQTKRERLFTIEQANGESSHLFPVFSLSEIDILDVELLIVTLKAYQVTTALMAWLPKLNPHCHILLLHNGIGTHEELAPRIAEHGLSLGTTSQAALKLSAQNIKQTGTGITQFGHVTGPLMNAELQNLLLNAIPDSCYVEHILTALWHKLAINAVINPLTAINDVPNGALAADKYQRTIDEVLTELFAVANRENIELDPAFVRQRVHQVIELTADNYSSMHQDIQHHRMTEIEYINGYLLRLACKYHLNLTTNQYLYQQITELERH